MPRELYRFRYRDLLTQKMVKARYAAEKHEIAKRYTEWELEGVERVLPDLVPGERLPFNNYSPGLPARPQVDPNVIQDPSLLPVEAMLARVFLRRHVTWCARTKRYAAMQGAAALHRTLGGPSRPQLGVAGSAT